MLTIECPYCGVMADETELSPGYEAHLKCSSPLAADFNMWRFKEGQFIDESVAAGVAH
jgi:sarcosine oxidase delta subunit